jgi:hypothetical protein
VEVLYFMNSNAKGRVRAKGSVKQGVQSEKLTREESIR